ncbi:MAG: metallophosphoesterase [Anaerolineaceae bacterium]
MPGVLISAGFLILDGVWISLLPVLNISYGETVSTWIPFAVLQIAVLCFCLVLGWILSFFKHPSFHKIAMGTLITLSLLLLGAGIDGFMIEPFRLTVSRIEIPVPGLKHPARIVQLSDIHVERTTKREREIPELVASLNPDLIVMTGDYPNETYVGDDLAGENLRELVSQLHAPLGIYAVNGNVEEPWMMPLLFKKQDIHILNDEVVKIPELGEHFTLIGMSYVDQTVDEMTLNRLMQQVKPDDFTLLLYHKPDLAYAARDQGIDLYLTGHTHGGQVRLPIIGALYTNSIYGKTFEMGLYHLDSMTMYVNRGLGMTGGSAPRVRFLAPPEVVVIDLVPLD